MKNFKCPNCGGNYITNGHCAYCNTQFLDIKENSDGTFNLNHYFETYQPNRPKAIKALCSDTGISIRKAKRLIDDYFDEKLKESHNDDLNVINRNLKYAWKEFMNE